MVLKGGDVGVGHRRRHQRALNLRARGVGGMHDAPGGVAPLASEVEGAGGVAGELGAKAGELQNVARALAAHNIHGAAQDGKGGGGKRGGGGVRQGRGGTCSRDLKHMLPEPDTKQRVAGTVCGKTTQKEQRRNARGPRKGEGVKEAANWGLTCGR